MMFVAARLRVTIFLVVASKEKCNRTEPRGLLKRNSVACKQRRRAKHRRLFGPRSLDRRPHRSHVTQSTVYWYATRHLNLPRDPLCLSCNTVDNATALYSAGIGQAITAHRVIPPDFE